MFSVLFRFFLLVCAAFLAALIAQNNVGPITGISVGIAFLSIPLIYSYINLARLRKYTVEDRLESMPLPSGYWEEVFFYLQRLVRNLKSQMLSVEKQHDRFIEAFQASPNGIMMLDDQDQIEWCNAISERFFGLQFKRDVMQRINFLIRRPEFIRYLHDRHFEEPLLLERMGPKSNLSLMLQAFPFGEKRHLLLVQDVTDLQNADAMRRDFVANVSHEIRTPLTVLSGFVETLQLIPLSENEQKRYLDLMAVQASRMQSLVADLLTLSQLEGSLPPGMNEKVAVQELMTQVASDAQSLSAVLSGLDGDQRHGVHVLLFEPAPAWVVLGVRSELLSAISNLVSNAVRYTPAGGTIRVVWSRDAEQVTLSVSDTGPGIAPEHLPRLSERFYRVDRSRSRETGGTGLGLAITKHVAQRHGGELRIESQVGKGSTFTLVLPISRLEPQS